MALVRAKVYLAEVKQFAYQGSGVEVVFRAAVNEHNKLWAAATPNLSLSMTVKNPLAAEALVPRLGGEFYLDFTPVEEEPDSPVDTDAGAG